MEYCRKNFGNISVSLATFRTAHPTAPREVNAVLHTSPGSADPYSVISDLADALARLQSMIGNDARLQFARFMVADEAWGKAIADSSLCAEAARTVVVQTPLDGSPVAIWLVWISSVNSSLIGNNLLLTETPHHRILWQGDSSFSSSGSLDESREALENLQQVLRRQGTSIPESCHRTWFIVRDIDNNYRGVVEGRNDVFGRLGLTRLTHFIASTGIGGAPANPRYAIAFNSYSVIGLQPHNIRYLKAAANMNNTMDYGVAFERGTLLDFPDRRQILISGTASIDRFGRILHEGDVERQALRMIENVDALIHEAGASRSDIGYIIVYLRNPGDYGRVRPIIEREFQGGVPFVIVHAPVCRKGWLVEMECSLLAPRD